MGWIKDTVDDLSWMASFSKMGWRRRTFFAVVLLFAFYFAVDAGKFGDSGKKFLTAHGFSVLNDVQITPEIQVLDDPQRTNSESGLNVTSSGIVKPPTEGAQLKLTLQKVDGTPLVAAELVPHSVPVDKQGFWNMTKPFVITEPGRYQIGYELSAHYRTLAATSKPVPGITSDSAFDSVFFVKPYLTREIPPAPTRSTYTNRKRVCIFFVGSPNFSVTVFDELLLRLNPLLESIALEIAPDPNVQMSDAGRSTDERLFSALKSAGASQPNNLCIGVFAGGLEANDYAVMTEATDSKGRKTQYAILATDETEIFGLHSDPSIYKALLTAIVAISAVQAGHGVSALEFHTATRGCLFDRDDDKVNARIGVEVGYLCQDHRRRYGRLLSRAEFHDLTQVLPLSWLK